MDGPGGLNWKVKTTETGRSWIKLDGPKDFKRPVCESGPEPSTSTLRFIPRDRPLLVEWPSTLTHDRPLWLKRPFTIVLDRPLWLEWPSSLAQDRPLLDGPSTFARPFTLRTVHFHPQIYNYDSKKYEWSRYKKINLDSIILQWFLKLMDIFSHQWRSNVVPEIRILGFLLDCFQKWH